jgi:hypothetical protein
MLTRESRTPLRGVRDLPFPACQAQRLARLSEACVTYLSLHAGLNDSHASERRATMVTRESRTPLRGVRDLPFPAREAQRLARLREACDDGDTRKSHASPRRA